MRAIKTFSLLLLCAVVITASDSAASEWILDANGNWNLASNWLGPIPDDASAIALFGSTITGDRSVLVTDPIDNNVTVGQLEFDGHFGYTLNMSDGQTFTLGDGISATILLPGNDGNASHQIEGDSGTDLALPQDFVVQNDSAGVLTMEMPVSGSNTVLTKLGYGELLFGSDSRPYTGSAEVLVKQGTFSGSLSFSEVLVLDGGRYEGDTNPNVSQISIGPNGGTIDAPGTLSISSNELSGSGRLRKEDSGALVINTPQPGFSGSIEVRAGEIIANSTSQPLAHATQFSIDGMMGNFAGQVLLSATNYSAVPITVGAGGVLVAPSAAGIGFASMTRGGNLSLAPGAVVAQTTSGGNASIQGLGPTQDLFFGIGTNQNISALTIGAGTPWLGISNIQKQEIRLNSTGSGTITAASDFTLQHYDYRLFLYNTNIISTGTRRTVTISCPTGSALQEGVFSGGIAPLPQTNGVAIRGTANLSGVGKFVVTAGANFNIETDGVAGTVPNQVPLIEVQVGGAFGRFISTTDGYAPTGTLGFGAAAATIHALGTAYIALRNHAQAGTPIGGNFVFEGGLPSLFTGSALDSSSTNTLVEINSLTLTGDGASVNGLPQVDGLTSINSNSAAINIVATTAGTTIAAPNTLVGGLSGTGGLTLGGRGTLVIQGAVAFGGLNSTVAIDAGVLKPANNSFDIGPDGPSIDIGSSVRLISAGVYSLPTNVDASSKLTPDSSGVLAIASDNNSITGTNGSAAYIGSDGTHALNVGSLTAGAGNVYRLGGGINSPVLNLSGINALVGENDVVVGMPVSIYGSPLSNGTGTVVLQGTNSYTGSTTVNAKSTLAVEAVGGIGNGPNAAGPLWIDGTLIIRSGGSLGTTGSITVNYGGQLQIDDSSVRNVDRIPDETAILLKGGTVNYVSSAQVASGSTETIGSSPAGMSLVEGSSTVGVTQSSSAPATLTVGQLNRQLGTTLHVEGATHITLGNGNALMANGIIPWLGGDFGSSSLFTNTSTGLATYSGPSPAQIEGASATDNVQTTSTVAPLTANRTINSLRMFGNIDTGGHVLNVGTVAINSVASGAIVLASPQTIGSGANPGYLTAGQAAFAANSAAPGELVMFATGNPATIASAIIDNAGPDGIFGDGDDLPVSLTKAGAQILNLTNPNNSYTGGTFIDEGTLSATVPIPGNVVLHSGSLQMSSAVAETYVVGGDITVSNSLNTSAITATIQATYTGYSGPSLLNPRLELRLHGLTVTPGSNVTLKGDMAIMGATDFRGAHIFIDTSGVTPGLSSVRIRGPYTDDVNTVLASASQSGVGALPYLDGYRFQTGGSVDVHATFAGSFAISAEQSSTVNFFGILSPTRVLSPSPGLQLAAASNGMLRLMPGAVIDAANGWTGESYSSQLLELQGDSTGSIEFTDGFKLMQVAGTNHLADLGANNITFDNPVTWITNQSDNLPNFDASVMNELPPNIYLGHISMQSDGAQWRVQTNPQTYNQQIDIVADSRIITNSALTFASASAVEMDSGSLEKLGPADLTILGRLYVANYAKMIVSQGRLVLANKSYEGYGQMDVDVRSGATLAGGSIDATAGLIPGTLTVESGGIVDPGNNPYGILSVVGDHPDVKFLAGSIFAPEIGGTVAGQLYDQLRLQGLLQLGDSNGLPILDPKIDYAPNIGDLLFLIRDDSTSPVAGLFETMQGMTLNQNDVFGIVSDGDHQTYQFQISYDGDASTSQFETTSGNDVVLRVVSVPEPSALILMGIGFALASLGRPPAKTRT